MTVSRELPVTVLRHGDGTTEVVNHDTAEPCYACACCASWARSLQQLADAINAHEDEAHHTAGHNGFNVYPDCLVCTMRAGTYDEGLTDA